MRKAEVILLLSLLILEYFIIRVDIVIDDIVVGYLFVFGPVCGWVFFKEGNRICGVDF